MKMHKNMTNVEIKDLLESVAAAYSLRGGANTRFRVIAYENAASAIEHLSTEAKDLWDEGKLEDISGVGPAISEYLGEIFEKGKSEHFKKVLSKYPPAMFELLKVSGIGPKSAYKLTKELGIKSSKKALSKLQEAAEAGRIAEMEGFGEDSEKSILKAIKEVEGRENRLLMPIAADIADKIINWMKESPEVKEVNTLGSLRRKASTIGDIDIAAASNDPEAAIEHFINYPNASRVLEKGERTASIIVPGDRQVDLMVGSPESYGAMLQHFTGSKHHNIALREYAQKKNMKVSDYGITKKNKLHEFDNEKDFYKFLGMEWIPPEMRENTDEIKKALNNNIPDLIELKQIKGDLQIHSDYDIETSHDIGSSTMKEYVEKAAELNYEYIAFTEHNPSQKGHKENDFHRLLTDKSKVIEQINKITVKDMKSSVKKVYNSLEIDILPDGNLPLGSDSLELLDFALVSIHSSFRQSKKESTKRVLKALDNPKVKIFAHPTGRILGEREGVDLDWKQIFEFCLKNNKWIEINADPHRLDLPDFLVREAVEKGVKLTLGTDSHNINGMENMKYGVYVARRGWATKLDIVNTRSYSEFEKLLKKA